MATSPTTRRLRRGVREDARGSAAALLQYGLEIGAGELQGGGESEEDAGEGGDGQGEEQHGQAERDLLIARQGEAAGFGDGGGEQVGGPPGEQESERAAGRGEQYGFDEKLAHQAAASGAQCQAEGDLLLTAAGAAEEQVGDVGAGDEQQKGDGA